MKFAICSAVSLLALAASPALAQDAAERDYVQVTLGSNFAGNADVSAESPPFSGSVDNDLRTGVFGSISSGHSFNESVAAELEAVYFQAELDDVDATATTYAVMLNGIYRIPTSFYSASPYVGVGVGYGLVEYKVLGASDEDLGVAFQVKAGFTIPVTDSMTADVGYRYLQLPKYEVSEGAESLKAETGAHIVSVGLRFGF